MLIRPRARRILVPRDDNGQLSGYQTEHWDDHVDATVLQPTIRAELTPREYRILHEIAFGTPPQQETKHGR